VPVADGVGGGVGSVGHHDDDGVAAAVIEAVNDGAAETVFVEVLDGSEGGNGRTQFLEHGPCAVFGAIVDDDDFVGNLLRRERCIDRGEGGGEGLGLIARGDDNAEERKRSERLWRSEGHGKGRGDGVGGASRGRIVLDCRVAAMLAMTGGQSGAERASQSG
jgi:hypothetical protein